MTATKRILPPEFVEKVKRLCPKSPGSNLHDWLDSNAAGNENALGYIQRHLSDISQAAEKSLPPKLILEMLDEGKVEELRQMAQNAAELAALHGEYQKWAIATD